MTRTRAFGGTNSASKVVTTLAVMLPRLEGRVILITGAGSGIGRAHSAARGDRGGDGLAAVDVDADGLNSTVDAVRVLGGQITTSVTDVSDRKALTAAIDATAGEVGPFHGVFANAAVLPSPVPVDALDWQEWDQVLSVNLTGAVLTLTSSLGHIVDGGSLLVNGSSMAIRPRRREDSLTLPPRRAFTLQRELSHWSLHRGGSE